MICDRGDKQTFFDIRSLSPLKRDVAMLTPAPVAVQIAFELELGVIVKAEVIRKLKADWCCIRNGSTCIPTRKTMAAASSTHRAE